MNLRFIDWIWHVRGSVALAPDVSSDAAFDRLDPLFRQTGTTHERTGDTLTFRKKDQAAQDKMSIFNDGFLRIERGVGGAVLRYHLTSRALLYCFLAPLLFLSFAGLTIAIGHFQKPSSEAADKAKKDKEKEKALPQHWIDKALGAPAPEDPKEKEKKEKDKKDKGEDDKPSPTPAYVFAGIFAALYVVGRILEDWLIKSLFKKRLLG